LVAVGVLMIIAALGLVVSNTVESRRAARYSAEALEKLKDVIPAEPSSLSGTPDNDDLFSDTERAEETETIEIDGYTYCGYISVEPLGIELPVADSFSYAGLKRSPCRYSGAAGNNDLIIAAHNYSSHFGRLYELSPGEQVVFTSASGRKYRYKVVDVEVIDGGDAERMFSGASGEWDMTLFTCTLSGRSRVTVRAKLITE